MPILNIFIDPDTLKCSVEEITNDRTIITFYFLKDNKPVCKFEGLHFGFIINNKLDKIVYGQTTPGVYMISDKKYLTDIEYLDKNCIAECNISLDPKQEYMMHIWCKDIRSTGDVVSNHTHVFTS
jgi:hypothetical protein